MKTIPLHRILSGTIKATSAAFCLTLFSTTGIAHEPVAKPVNKPAADAPRQERLISIVVLLHEPMNISEHTLGKAVSKALGVKHSHDETDANFVVSKPPYYLVKLKSGSYVINNMSKPYFDESDKLAEEIKDPELRKAVVGHHAWFSIDWAQKQAPENLQRTYQDVGKIVAELAGQDALAIYSPDLDQLQLYSEGVARDLRSDDPLQAFGDFSSVSDIVSISDDDPLLKAAEAEARKGWPEFMKAFREKSGTEFVVKGRIVEGDNAEYMWLSVTSIDGEKVHGMLDNKPAIVSNLKMGQDLHIKVEDMDDWLYLDPDKKSVGGFTIKVLEKTKQP
ncbi:hypothetical protein BH11VER1_BH11VER1_01130 [soil metagenome]